MSIQKTTIAAALLLALTACSSGGKNNTDYLESQVKNLQNKAELAQKKAEQATKRAEKAEKKAKEQAEQAKKETENALNNLEESVKNALDETETAKANINKLAKIASQEGVEQAESLARKNSKLSEEQFKDFLKKRKENYKVLKDQALKAGLTDWEASNFAYDNQDKAKSESDEELNILKARAEKERKEQLARENKRQELVKLANDNGLESWQADNFANEFQDKTLEEAKVELKKRKEEAVTRENKRQDLIKLATNNGLEEWQANNFASEYQDKPIEEAKANLAKRKEFKALAEEKGLDEQQAKEFAQNNANVEREEAIKQLDEQVQKQVLNLKRGIFEYGSQEKLNRTTPVGLHLNIDEKTVPLLDEKGFETGKTRVMWVQDIYNQSYSVVSGKYFSKSPEYHGSQPYYEFNYQGLRTTEKNLPVAGKATYQGVAFTHNKQGQLTYDVDFGKKEGQGSITGLSDIGTLTLEKDKLGKRNNTMSIEGNVVAESWKNEGVTGTYSLDFYGPKAEEIAGTARLVQSERYDYSSHIPEISGYREYKSLDKAGTSANSNYYDTQKRLEVGFGGTRGEIQK